MATVKASKVAARTFTVTLTDDEAAQLGAILGQTSGLVLDELYNALSAEFVDDGEGYRNFDGWRFVGIGEEAHWTLNNERQD